MREAGERERFIICPDLVALVKDAVLVCDCLVCVLFFSLFLLLPLLLVLSLFLDIDDDTEYYLLVV